jgi:hypothetical protein
MFMKTATIKEVGRRYTTYVDFAVKNGYPNAAVKHDDDDKRQPLVNLETVTVLFTGKHLSCSDTICVIQKGNGDQYLIGEAGLSNITETPDGVTVVTEETGVQREYRQVSRSGVSGDKVLVVAAVETGGQYANGDIFTVKRAWGFGDGIDLVEISRDMYRSEYVVLEPTDIVVIDDQRWNAVVRKAKVGERVLIVSTDNCVLDKTEVKYPIGTVITVKRIDTDRVRADWYVVDGDYAVLQPVTIPVEPQTPVAPTSDDIVTRLATLAANYVALEKRVASLEDAKTAPVKFAKIAVAPTLTRQDVIDRAIADVELLIEIGGQRHGRLPQGPYESRFYSAELIVNSAKRAVTALIRNRESSRVQETGKSRCAVDDVFNAHIGKAIALRRALGLDVPSVYTNAPQPTEPQIGDIVESCGYSGPVYAINPQFRTVGVGAGQNFGKQTAPFLTFIADCGTVRGYEFWAEMRKVRIIDDSRLTKTAVAA